MTAPAESLSWELKGNVLYVPVFSCPRRYANCSAGVWPVSQRYSPFLLYELIHIMVLQPLGFSLTSRLGLLTSYHAPMASILVTNTTIYCFRQMLWITLIGGPYVFTLCFLAQCQLAILEYYCGRVALNLGPCLSSLQKEQSWRVMVPGW